MARRMAYHPRGDMPEQLDRSVASLGCGDYLYQTTEFQICIYRIQMKHPGMYIEDSKATSTF